jgi:hypothetical protein
MQALAVRLEVVQTRPDLRTMGAISASTNEAPLVSVLRNLLVYRFAMARKIVFGRKASIALTFCDWTFPGLLMSLHMLP